jgi:hypothetical protein
MPGGQLTSRAVTAEAGVAKGYGAVGRYVWDRQASGVSSASGLMYGGETKPRARSE